MPSKISLAYHHQYRRAAKTIELKGHDSFDTTDLIKGAEAMIKQWDAEWQEAFDNQSDDYDGRYDDYSSIYPDNFWNE